jgi:phosphomannomutase/phosphoglucomutase
MLKTDDVHIDPFGFREYDARWIYPKNINQEGIKVIGLGLGAQIISKTNKSPRVIVGHDYRSYSEEVKKKLIEGLINAGCQVEDVGLALSPMVYFAQFNLNADAVAMITASHNENGWTGIKMGIKKGLTHSENEMKELKDIVFKKKFIYGNGSYKKIKNFKDIYISNLTKNKIKNKIKAVVACGNGTAGVFAPKVLENVGCNVIEVDCNLDYNFPKYNPNPEDLKMLRALGNAVKKNKADIGFAFDGDGDRLGVVNEKGHEIFSDKIGLLLARNLSFNNKNSKFIVDVKSTGLFKNDDVLKKNLCETIYWKTGHSYIKRKVNKEKALAGFEKSGHFFFNKPLGLGYDDAIMSAIQVCKLLDQNLPKKISNLLNELPTTYQSPTMAPHCDDSEKYKVIDIITNKFKELFKKKIKIAGKVIIEILTVNGIRFTLEDGSWGLVRASSNKPSLVVVIESVESVNDTKVIFTFINKLLKATGKIGQYDQKI